MASTKDSLNDLIAASGLRATLKEAISDLLKLPAGSRPGPKDLVEAVARKLLDKNGDGASGSAPATAASKSRRKIDFDMAHVRFREAHKEKCIIKRNSPHLNEPAAMTLQRRTKIVATLGPASFSTEVLGGLIAAGVDVLRLNASHRRAGQFEELIPRIRALSREQGRTVEILLDLQGPKFRVTEVEGGAVQLVVGSTVVFGLTATDDEKITANRILVRPTTEQLALVESLKQGNVLLINDGLMQLEVLERIDGKSLSCKVVVGGKLTARKGVNVPELQIKCSALTVKDIADAKDFLSDPKYVKDIDYLALSFVQTRSDIQEMIDLMDKWGVAPGDRPKIIPKIEKPVALENIDEILDISDGMMVARGDLGVELGLERIPFAQKSLIRAANKARKFCIVATQMMESMCTSAVPTRAEVSDVANAVYDGSDAVMLSGESAMGKHPVVVVDAMGRICVEAEKHHRSRYGYRGD